MAMEAIKQKELAVDLRSISTTKRSARFIASSDAVDSYGEVVKQNWDFGRFNTNPVVLYNHMRSGSDLPIGTASVEIVGGKLECEITFASEKASPQAEKVWTLVQEKVLRAVSVGFRPKTIRQETLGSEDVWVLDDNELYEISVTPIGANPEALMKSRATVDEENRQLSAALLHARSSALDLATHQQRARAGEGPLYTPATRSAEPSEECTIDALVLADRERRWSAHLARRSAAATPSVFALNASASETLANMHERLMDGGGVGDELAEWLGDSVSERAAAAPTTAAGLTSRESSVDDAGDAGAAAASIFEASFGDDDDDAFFIASDTPTTARGRVAEPEALPDDSALAALFEESFADDEEAAQ